MKYQLFCEPQSGMFLCQILGGVNLSYNLYLGHLKGPWKGIIEEYNTKKVLHHSFSNVVP